MTDPLLEFIADSPNFGFLVHSSSLLAGDGASAEAYIRTDPDAAMSRARRFGETAVDLLLRHYGVSVPPDRRGRRPSFDVRIRTLIAGTPLPPAMASALRQLQHGGNQTAHAYLHDQAAAAAAVQACFDLGVFWHGLTTGRPVNLTYTSPPDRPPSRELLERIERRLDRLRGELDAQPAPVITIGPAAPDPHRWRGGSAVRDSYVVHDPVTRITADDGSWTLLEANGRSLDARAEQVRLRAVLVGRPGPAATRMVGGLAAQAAFLRSPRDHLTDGSLHVLVTARPAGSTWWEAFGEPPVDPFVVPLAVDAAASVADALAALHRAGGAHLALHGDSVLVAGRRGVLRDLGLAWWPPIAGAGGDYRAPEQRTTGARRPGAATDVFQLAALLWHTCGGVGPSGGFRPQLSVLLPGFPAALDALLARALDPDQARRPDAAGFAAGLRRGRSQLVTGAIGGY